MKRLWLVGFAMTVVLAGACSRDYLQAPPPPASTVTPTSGVIADTQEGLTGKATGNSLGPPLAVQVPDLLFLTLSEARAAAKAAGLHLRVKYGVSALVDPGTVFDQSALFGTVGLGATITVHVAKKPGSGDCHPSYTGHA
jgi:hypothetical protein